MISVPNNKMIQKKAGKLIDSFKDMVFPEGYVPGAKRRVSCCLNDFWRAFFVSELKLIPMRHLIPCITQSNVTEFNFVNQSMQ